MGTIESNAVSRQMNQEIILFSEISISDNKDIFESVNISPADVVDTTTNYHS